MSNTELLWDSGNIHIPGGPARQIGPTLDVRKYSEVRVCAHDSLPGGPGNDMRIHFRVKEGNVAIELPQEIALIGGNHHATAVIDVPGREMEVFVRELTPPFVGRNLQVFVFGHEG